MSRKIFLVFMIAALPVRAQDVSEGRTGYFLGKENRLEISVNVWGEVTRPGIYRVPDDTDLVGLLSVAGGPTQDANLRSVKMTRVDAAGERIFDVDLVRYLESRERGLLPPLRPGDTVRVARTARHRWGDALRTLSSIAVIASTYVYISDRLR